MNFLNLTLKSMWNRRGTTILTILVIGAVVAVATLFVIQVNWNAF